MPVIIPILKKSLGSEDAIPRDQLASVFARWLAPESHSEIYLEYGRDDHKEYLDTQVEIAQFGDNIPTSYRVHGEWYTHYQVRDGYTNKGQYLGAGIGISSNMQSASIAWVKGLKRVGLDFKRVAHDEDFWAIVSKDYRTHWVDLGAALVGDWDYKKFLFNVRLETVGSINYQHLYAPVPSDPPYWWDHGKVRYNIHAELGVTYLF